jgi:hypothetical protein
LSKGRLHSVQRGSLPHSEQIWAADFHFHCLLRLAGGFNRPARSQDLDPAIRAALAARQARLEGIRQLPGTTRSIAARSRKVWQADLDLEGSLATMLGLPSLRKSSAAFAPTSAGF